MRVVQAVSVLIGAVLTTMAIAIGDLQAGQVTAEACVACHGTDGNSVVPTWPKLAGQHAGYLAKQLLEFRKGEAGDRWEPSMYGMVSGLNDQDIQNLAAYFESQKGTSGVASANLVSLGEKIYRGGDPNTGVSACIACHGPSGDGNALAHFPKLSGQHPEYIAAQLKLYRSLTRKTDPNGIMRDVARRMSDEEIEAVSSYVSGLH